MNEREALKLALEALKNFGQENSDVCKSIKEVLAQHDSVQAKPEPEQEPVRVMGFDCVCGKRMKVSAEQGVTPAPQRPWVGLTDEEVASIYMNHTDRPMYEQWKFARAIEAKLKEKNGFDTPELAHQAYKENT